MMTAACILISVFAAPPAGAQTAAPEVASAAQKLVEKAEKAVLDPDRLAMVVRIRTTGSLEADLKTTWRWAPGQKARVDIDGTMLGLPVGHTFVSDGTYMQWPNNLVRAPPDVDRGLRLMLFRLGAQFNTVRIAAGEEPNVLDGTAEHYGRWAHVRVRPPEMIGKRRCIPIDHALVIADEPKGTGTLWIDAKTHLPVRRRAEVLYSGGTMKIEEVYVRVGRPKKPFRAKLFGLF